MLGLSKIDKHAVLVGRMADTLGVDLAEEMQFGRLLPEDYRSAVLSCTACRKAEECVAWLDSADGGADTTPDYCRNKMRLDAFAAR